MSNAGKHLIRIAALFTGTAVAIHCVNKFISKRANSKNILNKKQTYTYSWRFGNISYTRTGSGSPLLLVHELSSYSNSSEWNKVVSDLSTSHTVYCVDLPGCGLSERQNITYTNFYYVQMINDFIKNIIGEPVDIAATGLSASLAVTACNYDSELFKKLILVSPFSLQKLNQIPTRKSRAAKALLEMPLIGTLVYHIVNSRNRLESDFMSKLFADPFHVNEEYIDICYESSHRENSTGKYLFSSIIGKYIYFNITRALHNINNDVVIISGEYENNIEEIIETYQAVNPAVESCIIENARHLPQLEESQAFLDQLKIYLSE